MRRCTSPRRAHAVVAAAALLLAAAGCATAHPTDADHRETPRRSGGWTSGQLTAQQLDAVGAGSSLLEALGRLRPELLRLAVSPSTPEGSQPAVYIGGAPHGDLAMLATIPAYAVDRVQYLRASEASIRLGRALPAGAILVTMRKVP